MIIAAMAALGTSKANIVYTDIPDATLAGMGSVNINFDGTGGDEFTINDQSFGGAPEPGIFFNADAGFVMVSAAEWDVIKGLPLNTTINNSSSFLNNGADGYLDPFWGTTMFPTGADTYIGATFKLGTNVHYGWIRVNWDGAGTFIVKDFAYESTPNTAIYAGNEGISTGIDNIKLNVEIAMFPNPTTDYLNVELKNSNNATHEFSIIDVNGKIILNASVKNKAKLDIQHLSVGTYYIISNEKGGYIKHPFIKN